VRQQQAEIYNPNQTATTCYIRNNGFLSDGVNCFMEKSSHQIVDNFVLQTKGLVVKIFHKASGPETGPVVLDTLGQLFYVFHVWTRL
jgi:hypothetical protein